MTLYCSFTSLDKEGLTGERIITWAGAVNILLRTVRGYFDLMLYTSSVLHYLSPGLSQ